MMITGSKNKQQASWWVKFVNTKADYFVVREYMHIYTYIHT